MPKSQLITALDIGSGTFKILLAAFNPEEETFEVIYQDEEPAFGVRRGVVIDVEKVSRIIQIMLEKARAETGQKINSVYSTIGGSHIFSSFSRGTIIVSRADQNISSEDMDRVLQAAEAFPLPSNKQILEVLPREFIVDGEGGIKEPVGMRGMKLETEIVAVGGFSPYIKNLTQAILNSGVQNIIDIFPTSLASSMSVLSQRQKEIGVALLDIGAGTTELAVFEEGDLIHLYTFPIGSSNITNDIAIGFKTDIDLAEKIKIEFGSCALQGSDKKEKINLEGEDPLIFSRKTLNRIIEARVSEIFKEVQKELKKISKQGLLPAGLVLTGGGSKLPKIVEFAKKELKLPCSLGRISDMSGLKKDPRFAAVCGLVIQASLREGKTSSPSVGALGNKIKKILKIFIP